MGDDGQIVGLVAAIYFRLRNSALPELLRAENARG